MRILVILISLFVLFIGTLNASEIRVEKPTLEEVLELLGYQYWKFSIPNKEKAKIWSWNLVYYTKDKNSIWQEEIIAQSTQNHSYGAPEQFLISLFQKENQFYLSTGPSRFDDFDPISTNGIKHDYQSLYLAKTKEVDLNKFQKFPRIEINQKGEIYLLYKAHPSVTFSYPGDWIAYFTLRIKTEIRGE